MSTLGERDELVRRAKGWTEADLRKFPTATLELIDSLAAALVAEGQGAAPESEVPCNCGWIGHNRAAAPSLHKEGAGGAAQGPITGVAAGIRARARAEALEEAAKLVDKFTNPLKVAEKLSWLESPITFARVMEVISAEIRALAASPAGRAEQVSGATSAAKDGDAK